MGWEVAVQIGIPFIPNANLKKQFKVVLRLVHKLRRPKDCTMHWFRRMHSLQKFASIHAPFHNLFNSQRSLSERCTFKLNRDAALNKWHSLVSP